MNIFDFYLPEQVLVAFSLIVLMIVLTKILWKPLTNIIDSRQKGVDDMLHSAEEAKRIVADMEKQRVNQSAELERLIADKTNEARERAARGSKGIARQPEKEKSIRMITFLGIVLAEACAIYGLLVAFIIIGNG